MNKQKHILLVRSAYPAKGFVLKKLKELGYFVIVLDSTKNCPPDLVDDWILADITSEKKCLEAIDAYISSPGKHIDGAVTFWESAVLLTTRITDTFGWVGIPHKTAHIIKNKFKFRQKCEENELPTPKYHTLHTEEELKNIAYHLKFPVVVKPIFGAASTFVIKANNPKELKQAYRSIKRDIATLQKTKEWHNLELYVEEYIEGNEVDIDILIQDGEIVFWSLSDNFQTDEPYFVETGQAIPSSLSNKKQSALIAMAKQMLASLGITNGCIHFEAKYSPSGPIPIEINMRMGGDEVYNFVRFAWNVDLIEYAAAIALNKKITIKKPEKPLTYLEGKYYLPKKSGEISKIEISQSLYTDVNFFEFHEVKHVGDTISIPPYSFESLGWIIVTGKNGKDAHRNLRRMYSKVKFSIKPYAKPYLQTYI